MNQPEGTGALPVKRVLFFSHVYGNSTFITNTAKSVETRHVLKYVCCSLEKDEAWEDFKLRDIEVIPFELPLLLKRLRARLETWDLRLSFSNRAFGLRLKTVIEEFKPDIIHCQYGYEALILLDNYYDPRGKFLISFHGYDASAKLRSRAYRSKLGSFLDRENVYPVFCSQHLKDNLLQAGMRINGRNLLLHFGVDTDFFKRESRDHPREVLIFLQVSTFREKKGHQFTLLAFREFLRRNPQRRCKLIFTGDIRTAPRLKAQVSALGLDEVVEFAGYTTPAETRALFERAHFFVQHSFTPPDGDQEGMPNSIMEAMAMELPIVSTRHSGIPELVEEGVNGLLVAEKDVESYATRLSEIAEWGYQPQNRAKIQENFSAAQHRQKLLAFYDAI